MVREVAAVGLVTAVLTVLVALPGIASWVLAIGLVRPDATGAAAAFVVVATAAIGLIGLGIGATLLVAPFAPSLDADHAVGGRSVHGALLRGVPVAVVPTTAVAIGLAAALWVGWSMSAWGKP